MSLEKRHTESAFTNKVLQGANKCEGNVFLRESYQPKARVVLQHHFAFGSHFDVQHSCVHAAHWDDEHARPFLLPHGGLWTDINSA